MWGRGAQSLGNTQALKPTNGILIALRGREEGKKKVIFNHEVPHLVYRVVSVLPRFLPFSLSLSPTATYMNNTFNSTVAFNSVCYYDNATNQPMGGAGTDSTSRCLNEKNDVNYTRSYSGCVLDYIVLCDSTKRRAQYSLLQLCVFIF